MLTHKQTKLLLFSQHGLNDNNQKMESLAQKVAPPQTYVVAPNLGIKTFFAIEPLISEVERSTEQTFKKYPDIPARIIAVSLGGILWVEVLSRHPEWWQRFESLILLGSPLGGADLARIIDPFGWGIGIAKELGRNRRPLAEKITAKIPTLVVAGNTTGGGDHTVSVESTKLKYAHFVCLKGVSHPKLRTNPRVANEILEFWSSKKKPLPALKTSQTSILIEHFRSVIGITDADERDFPSAKIVHTFEDGTSIRTWTNLVGVQHVFIANKDGECEYAAFVGWIHSSGLQQAIDVARQFN